MQKEYRNNPDNLADGERCFAVCIPAFNPANRGTSLDRPECRKVMPGTYKSHRFLPDELMPETTAGSLIYLQVCWIMWEEEESAEISRTILEKEGA